MRTASRASRPSSTALARARNRSSTTPSMCCYVAGLDLMARPEAATCSRRPRFSTAVSPSSSARSIARCGSARSLVTAAGRPWNFFLCWANHADQTLVSRTANSGAGLCHASKDALPMVRNSIGPRAKSHSMNTIEAASRFLARPSPTEQSARQLQEASSLVAASDAAFIQLGRRPRLSTCRERQRHDEEQLGLRIAFRVFQSRHAASLTA